MTFDTIPIDANTELILLVIWVGLIIGMIVVFFLFLISRQRLGRISSSDILTFLLHPTGTYEIKSTSLKKEEDMQTLQTSRGGLVFDLGNKTAYKPQGAGPIIAMVDSFSQSTEPLEGRDFTLDGNVIDSNAISQWLGTTSPENTPAQELERGRADERRNGAKNPGDIMVYIMAFIVVIIGGLIAYEVLK